MAIKAGVILTTEFAKPGSQVFAEYLDYMTREEAVEHEPFVEYELYQNYMDNPNKSTGVFTADKNSLTKIQREELRDIYAEAQERGSFLWKPVISFDMEWLEKNGLYIKDKDWVDEKVIKEATRSAVDTLLTNEEMPNAVWNASFHYNTDNLHIHVGVVDPLLERYMKPYVQMSYYEDPFGTHIKTSGGIYKRISLKNMHGKDIKKETRYRQEIQKDKDGNPIIKDEFCGTMRMKNINAAKSRIVNQIVLNKDYNLAINNIMRKHVIDNLKTHPLAQDPELVTQFMGIYHQLPDNKGLWKYNLNKMKPIRDELDQLASGYMNKYHVEDIRELNLMLDNVNRLYKEAYGDDKQRDYKKNKLKDFYERLGNTILKKMSQMDYEAEIRSKVLAEQIAKAQANENLYDEENIDDVMVGYNPFTEEYILYDAEEGIENETPIISEQYIMEWSKNYKKAKQYLYQETPNYESALYLLEDEATRNNVLALADLGRMYDKGIGIDVDEDRAYELYSRGLKGFLQLEPIIEDLILNKTDKITEKTKAFAMNQKVYVQYRIGKMYMYGQGTEKDPEEAVLWYEKAAKAGNQYAQYSYGSCFFYGNGVEQDYEKAKYWYECSYAKKNIYAAYALGQMSEGGLAGEKDLKQAYKYYEKALEGFLNTQEEQQDENIKYRIGYMLLTGKGTKVNPDAAIPYLESAVGLGNERAKIQLAKAYIQSQEDNNYSKGIELLSSIVENDEGYAAYILGKEYLEGKHSDYEQAEKYLILSADKGYEHAQYILGKEHLTGERFEQDAQEAEKYLTKAVEQNNSYAQYTLGKAYLIGDKLEQNVEKAEVLLVASATQDNEYAQYLLGREHLSGERLEADLPKAETYLLESASQGNQFAQYTLGKEYLSGDNFLQDIAKAEAYLLEAASQDNQQAQYLLGREYLTGKQLKQDFLRAEAYLQKSAKQDNQFAQYVLGKEYLTGDNFIQDVNQAEALLLGSARQGNEYAQYTLGREYLTGERLEQNIPEAEKHLVSSARQGNSFAQYTLGREYVSGERFGKDIGLGLRYLESSAEQDNEFAQYTLGKMYMYGEGVKQDTELGKYYLALAAHQGNEYASDLLNGKVSGKSNNYVAEDLLREVDNVVRALKRAMNNDVEKFRNEIEHEKFLQEQEFENAHKQEIEI